MKTLIVLLLLSPASFGQSPFDGTWIYSPPLQQNPAVYLLAKGMFRCSGCMAEMEVKADGDDHQVAETACWDTLNVQRVDACAVVIIAKKAGKTMLTEVDAISPDGNTLFQVVKDTTEAETVTNRNPQSTNQKRARGLSRHFRLLARLQNHSIQERFGNQVQMYNGRIQCGVTPWRKIRRKVRW